MQTANVYIRIGTAVALLLCTGTARSEAQTLQGSDVIVFPASGIPFLHSHKVVIQGEKDADGCSFPLDSDASPHPLTSNQRWISVQLAHDPHSCQELLERGVVDLSTHPEAAALLQPSAPSKSP